MPTRSEKVVYVLGAGFSKPAGAPSQSEILARIFDRNIADDRYVEGVLKLRHFLNQDMGLGEAEIARIPLEDLYTPIDRCIADRTSLRSYSATDLVHFREELGYLISKAITKTISDNTQSAANGYIRDFARYLVKIAYHRAVLARDSDSAQEARNYDPLSVVSLNWDILLDNALENELEAKD